MDKIDKILYRHAEDIKNLQNRRKFFTSLIINVMFGILIALMSSGFFLFLTFLFKYFELSIGYEILLSMLIFLSSFLAFLLITKGVMEEIRKSERMLEGMEQNKKALEEASKNSNLRKILNTIYKE